MYRTAASLIQALWRGIRARADFAKWQVRLPRTRGPTRVCCRALPLVAAVGKHNQVLGRNCLLCPCGDSWFVLHMSSCAPPPRFTRAPACMKRACTCLSPNTQDAALQLQSWWRMVLHRDGFHVRVRAATRIQAAWRGELGRRRMELAHFAAWYETAARHTWAHYHVLACIPPLCWRAGERLCWSHPDPFLQPCASRMAGSAEPAPHMRHPGCPRAVCRGAAGASVA